MCRDYYVLRAKLEEICQRPAEALDEGALMEIKAKMSAHIRNCAECQENFKMVKQASGS